MVLSIAASRQNRAKFAEVADAARHLADALPPGEDQPQPSLMHQECAQLAEALVSLISELDRGLLDLRDRARLLNAGTPEAVAMGWQHAGSVLHEERLHHDLALSRLRRQATADLRLAEELVTRLRRNQDELQHAVSRSNMPFEEAAARLFRLPVERRASHDDDTDSPGID